MTAVATQATTTTAQKGIDRGVMVVFAGRVVTGGSGKGEPKS